MKSKYGHWATHNIIFSNKDFADRDRCKLFLMSMISAVTFMKPTDYRNQKFPRTPSLHLTVSNTCQQLIKQSYTQSYLGHFSIFLVQIFEVKQVYFTKLYIAEFSILVLKNMVVENAEI